MNKEDFYWNQAKNKLNKNIEVYDADPLKNKNGKTLKECATNADYIFLCIPSWVEEAVLLEIALCLKKGAILISLSKGITMNGRKSIDVIFQRYRYQIIDRQRQKG